ncbi:MAG: hypothetical protein IJT41_06630 [Clostridia bacterium]|nr:hypothetical protein [Clostridia bacterium]
MRKIRFPAELAYLTALVMLAFAVAMTAASDLGVSMIVAPAYILSLKIDALTFGQSEYIVQGLLFIAFCLLMRRVKAVYFSAFLTGLIYGAVLDFWRLVIPHFNPAVTPIGSLGLPLRILYFIGGTILCAVCIALFFHTYLYPQIYDFFVKGVSARYGLNRTRFKIAYDAAFLAAACAMSLLLFRKFVGVGVGTLITTAVNGVLIGFFDKLFEKHFDFSPLLPRFAARFALDERA